MKGPADKVSEFPAASNTNAAHPYLELPPQPHRAVTLTLEIEADDRKSMIQALEDYRRQIALGILSHGFTGGYDWAAEYRYEERPGPTHAEYADQLAAYLGALRIAPASPEMKVSAASRPAPGSQRHEAAHPTPGTLDGTGYRRTDEPIPWRGAMISPEPTDAEAAHV